MSIFKYWVVPGFICYLFVSIFQESVYLEAEMEAKLSESSDDGTDDDGDDDDDDDAEWLPFTYLLMH